jgi:hypothetical protein
MLDHVADLVGIRLVPAEMVVAGVDDQDVALADLYPLLDRFGRIDLIVACCV